MRYPRCICHVTSELMVFRAPLRFQPKNRRRWRKRKPRIACQQVLLDAGRGFRCGFPEGCKWSYVNDLASPCFLMALPAFPTQPYYGASHSELWRCAIKTRRKFLPFSHCLGRRRENYPERVFLSTFSIALWDYTLANIPQIIRNIQQNQNRGDSQGVVSGCDRNPRKSVWQADLSCSKRSDGRPST